MFSLQNGIFPKSFVVKSILTPSIRVRDISRARLLLSSHSTPMSVTFNGPNRPNSFSQTKQMHPISSPYGSLLFSSTTNQNQQSSSSSYQFEKIAFIGAGKMAQALIAPLIRTKVQQPSRMSIHDVSTSTMDKLSSLYGPELKMESSIPDCIRNADLIVCAVKPQNCDFVFQEIKSAAVDVLDADATLLSIIAGKPMKAFIDGSGITKVVRSMPNTPAMVGKGMTVWTCTKNVTEEEKGRVQTILGSFGETIYFEDESYIDMATSISGSGPAYIFMMMEAMIDAGVHIGFPRDIATKLAHQTILGSTMYAMETGDHPAVLRNSVTSPAGTTASAIYELENGKFRTVIHKAIWACYRKSLEMGDRKSVV